MNPLLLSLALILAGGIVPLLAYRLATPTRYLYVGLTVLGCLMGGYSVLAASADPDRLAWSWTWLQVFSLSFQFDSLSLFFLVPILVICPLAAVYSFGYFTAGDHSLKTAASFLFTNLLIVSMALVTGAANMVSFALVWEMMSVSSYFLVMHDYQKQDSRTAGYLYLLFAQAGALLIFASFGLLFSQTGSLDFAMAAAVPDRVKLLVFSLAFLGFGSKAGVFPLHVWLPHAHPAAPSHISAIMSGVMIKMGIYGILRLYFALGATDLRLGQAVLVFGMVSGILGVLYALGKHNLKRLLAYHSVENIGIILMGAGLGMIGVARGDTIMAGFGFAGCLLHVLNHSLFKSLLFFGAGAVLRRSGTVQVDRLGGLMKRMPVTGRTFLVGSVSISGLPPFNGFVSEFLVYFAAFQGLKYHNLTLLLAMAAILSLALIGGLASFCFTKVVGMVFLGEPRTEPAARASEGGAALTLPMVVLATCCLLIGIFPAPFIDLAFRAVGGLVPLGQVEVDLAALIGRNLALASRLFLALFLLVVLVRKGLYLNKAIGAGPTWGCGFTQASARVQYTGTSYARSVIELFRPFARLRETEVRLGEIFPVQSAFASRVDDIAEIGLNRGLALPLSTLLGKLRWIQHGNLQLYIGYIIVAILGLLLVLFL